MPDLAALGYADCPHCQRPYRVRDGIGHAADCDRPREPAAPPAGTWRQHRVEFVVLGKPVGYKAAADTGDGARRRPARYLQWQRQVRQAAVHAVGGPFPWYPDTKCPVILDLEVYLPRPRSGRRYPTSRNDGDEDNYRKAVKDALQAHQQHPAGIAYLDDAQVIGGRQIKQFAEQTGIRVVLYVHEEAIAP